MPHSICRNLLIILSLIAPLYSCGNSSDENTLGAQGNTAATRATIEHNAAVAKSLNLDDPRDREQATRGLIAAPENLRVQGPDGTIIWDMPAYAFVDAPAPDTVNPSLWRQAQLNNIHGLFEVTEGIYQLRGFDLSNMTLIRGDKGWIVIDPLTTRETAHAAMTFARQHLPQLPISAVLFTHSHIDHFGGAMGLLDAAPTADALEIIAPLGFLEEATSENVLAGSVMSRRAMYMYGSQLEHSVRGHVDSGLGKSPAFGSPGIATPTRIIKDTGERLSVDGVEFVFQNAAGSEAPAELTFYLPQFKAFCGAEVVSRNMHNVYTLRGAKVRDAKRWSHYIEEARNLFKEADIYFASHHWPIWGQENIQQFMTQQRDTYAYIHDQTLHLASQGLTPREIAETIRMPEDLKEGFSNRGYYGTLRHNSKAVYQRYFGWYDGNPANLDPLPPEQSAKRYVDLMGGTDNVIEQAQIAYDKGEYRWVAELLNHLMFAEPDNTAARTLLAATYDQLGYQAEAGPWRDIYLTGALELRQGAPEQGVGINNAVDLLSATPVEQFFDVMAVMLNGPKAQGERFDLGIEFTDREARYLLSLENAVLRHKAVDGDELQTADAVIHITHPMFIQMLTGNSEIRDVLFSDEVSISGSRLGLVKFFGLLSPANDVFEIVRP